MSGVLGTLCWGIYFIQSCCRSSGDSFSTASTSEQIEDFANRAQCCVMDGDLKEDRCCSLERAHPGFFDWFGCGFSGEEKNVPKKQYFEMSIQRKLIRILWLSCIIFALIGVPALLIPEYVVFNYAITDTYREQLGIVDMPPQDDTKKKKENDETLMKALDDVMDSIGHIFSADNGADNNKKKADLDATIQKLKAAREHLIYSQPEAVSMTVPTRLLGGLFGFYAILCAYHAKLPLKELLNPSFLFVHIIWFIANVIATTVASVAHGNGLATSWLMIVLAAVHVLGLFAHYYINNKVTVLAHIADDSI